MSRSSSSSSSLGCGSAGGGGWNAIFLQAAQVIDLVDQEFGVADVLDLRHRIICRAVVSMCLWLMLTPCSR